MSGDQFRVFVCMESSLEGECRGWHSLGVKEGLMRVCSGSFRVRIDDAE
jgi:hypothetical protein